MDEVLHFAEQLIEKNAKPDIVRDYYRDKNQILFGSLSDVITEYMFENQGLARELESLKTYRTSPLEEALKSEFLRVLSPFCQIPSTPWTFDEFCEVALHTIQNHENECRIDIARFRSNRKKIANKIKDMRHADIVSENSRVRIDQIKKRLAEIEIPLAESRKKIVELDRKNLKIRSQLVQSQRALEEKNEKLNKTLERKTNAFKNNRELRNSKTVTLDAIEDVNDKLRTRKLTQRFGNHANSNDIGTVIALRQTISELKRENEVLKENKKNSIIDRIKVQQREYLHNLIAMHA
jgi:hypothetical protein